MSKYFFSYLILLSINSVVFAQTKNDPEAKVVLDGVSEKFKTFKTVQALFTYKVENSTGKALSSKNGTVKMKGTKYYVNFSGQEIFCDGKVIWNYDRSANEVTITTLEEGGSTITPQKLFTNFYDKDFYYKLNGNKKVAGKTLLEIEMTPTDKSKPFHKVYLLVDKPAKSIFSTRVLETAGNRYSYTVSSMKTNLILPESQFIFNKSKYPGVEVIDLR